jgi:hypothetical protein
MQSWKWTARHAAVVAAAAALGFGLAELPLFRQVTLGTPRLTASGLVHFLGCATALAAFWLAAQRAARQMRNTDGAAHPVGAFIPALSTLLVACAASEVVLGVLRPFLSTAMHDAARWAFVIGITGCAVWLIAELHRHAEQLVDWARTLRSSTAIDGTQCNGCGAAMPRHARFCAVCGAPAADSAPGAGTTRVQPGSA